MELLKKIVDTDRMKRFQTRRELCRKSGVKEWFIRLARGELAIPIKVMLLISFLDPAMNNDDRKWIEETRK